MSVPTIILEFIRKTPAMAVAYSLFIIAYPLTAVVTPMYIGKLLNAVTEAHGEITHGVRKNLFIILVLYVVSLFLQTFLEIVDNIIAPRFYTFVRTKMIAYVINAYRRNFRHIEVGDAVYKIGNTPSAALKSLYQLRMLLLPGIVTIIGVTVYLFATHWSIGVMFLTVLVSYLVIYAGMVSTCMQRIAAAEQTQDKVMEHISDALENLINVYASGQSADQIARLERDQADLQSRMTAALICSTSYRFMSTFLIESFFVCGILLLMWLVVRGHLAASQMAPTALVLMRVQTLLFQLQSITLPLVYEIAVLRKIQTFLNRLPTDTDTDASAPSASASTSPPSEPGLGSIVTHNLAYAYGTTSVLRDVSVTINPAEKVIITGDIGSGKSTFVKILMGLLPYTGSVKVAGLEVRDTPQRQLATIVFYMPQEAPLFNKSVFYNMTYGNKATRADVQRLMDRFKIDYVTLDTPLGKRGSHISGGQRQILYLLRAFLTPAPIILLDEPTASLDQRSKTRLMHILGELATNRTVLMISHDTTIDRGMFTRHLVFEPTTNRL